MRKVLISAVCLVLLVFVSLSMCACDSSGDQKPTENGVLTEIKDDDGNVTGYERRYVNDNGDITRWDVYDENETYQYYVLYEYDDNNRLSAETRYKAEGFAEYRYTYAYDDEGNLIEKAYELPHGEAEVYRYNTDGEEVERLYYGTDEKLTKREVLENGKWVAYDPTENPTE